MTTPVVDAPIANQAIARAAKAIHKLEQLCPELSIFANILIGRDPNKRGAVKVQPGAQTATNGTTIFIRPDARMARDVLTDEQWSDIKASLFHEVAHIAFDTFAKATDDDRKRALEHVMAELPDSIRRDHLLASMEATGTYWTMCAVFHPLMHMLVNALEDARVEALLFKAKPGTQKHLERQRMEIFDGSKEEIEARIGTQWKDREPDQQAIIGCYLLGAQYAPEGRLSNQVAADLRSIDPVIQRACTSSSVAEVYGTAFEILTELQKLGYLRNGDERDADIGETEHEDVAPDGSPMQRAEMMGCPHPKAKIVPCEGAYCSGNCTQCGTHLISPPSTDKTGTEGESTESSEAEASDSAPDEGEASAASDEGARVEPTEGDSATEGKSPAPSDVSGTQEDGRDDAGASDVSKAEAAAKAEEDMAEALEAAGGHGSHDHKHAHKHSHDDDDPEDAPLSESSIQGALEFKDAGYDVNDQPASGVTRIRKRSFSDFYDGLGDIDRPEIEAAIARTMPELRKVLALNGLTGFTGGMRSGRVDTRALVRTATGHERVFGRFETAESRDYYFVLALDCSGSMGHGESGSVITQRNVALAAADMLDRLGVPFSVFGYSGQGGGGGWTLSIYDVRKPGDPWDAEARKRLQTLHGQTANLDGSTMQYARIQGRNAVRSPNTEVIVLYFNDGGMPAENSVPEKRLIQWEVRNQRRNGVHYIGVGINGATAVEKAGLELVPAKNVHSGVANITRKIGELLGVQR